MTRLRRRLHTAGITHGALLRRGGHCSPIGSRPSPSPPSSPDAPETPALKTGSAGTRSGSARPSPSPRPERAWSKCTLPDGGPRRRRRSRTPAANTPSAAPCPGTATAPDNDNAPQAARQTPHLPAGFPCALREPSGIVPDHVPTGERTFPFPTEHPRGCAHDGQRFTPVPNVQCRVGARWPCVVQRYRALSVPTRPPATTPMDAAGDAAVRDAVRANSIHGLTGLDRPESATRLDDVANRLDRTPLAQCASEHNGSAPTATDLPLRLAIDEAATSGVLRDYSPTRPTATGSTRTAKPPRQPASRSPASEIPPSRHATTHRPAYCSPDPTALPFLPGSQQSSLLVARSRQPDNQSRHQNPQP